MAEPTPRRAETRQRILDAAGVLFRQNGIDGVGVDAVMKQAGLTHGGFYAHFASKEALAAEVAQTLLAKAARSWCEISRTEDPDSALRRIVLAYLNPEKVASGLGCPLTSLGPDVARRSAGRSAVGGALKGMLEALARVMPDTPQPRSSAIGKTQPGHDEDRNRRNHALAALSTMVGAVILARLADDPDLARAFLDAAAESIIPAPANSPG
nr:TetR/AcrR family transcriptional regulator [uncultured Rhodopila sp.]